MPRFVDWTRPCATRASRPPAPASRAISRRPARHRHADVGKQRAGDGGERFTEQRLEIRRDQQRAGAPTNLDGLRIEEQVLPVDAVASAWGMWSADRRGLVPGGLGSEVPGISVVSGPPERLIGHAAGPPASALAVGIMAAVLLALGGALVWAARDGYVAQVWDEATR
jgi:hypothetical protein